MMTRLAAARHLVINMLLALLFIGVVLWFTH